MKTVIIFVTLLSLSTSVLAQTTPTATKKSPYFENADLRQYTGGNGRFWLESDITYANAPAPTYLHATCNFYLKMGTVDSPVSSFRDELVAQLQARGFKFKGLYNGQPLADDQDIVVEYDQNRTFLGNDRCGYQGMFGYQYCDFNKQIFKVRLYVDNIQAEAPLFMGPAKTSTGAIAIIFLQSSYDRMKKYTLSYLPNCYLK